MGTGERLEEEIRQGLINLQREAEQLRKAEPGSVEDHINNEESALENSVLDHRVEATAKLKDYQIALETKAAEQEKASRLEQTLRDAEAIKKITHVETQYGLWNAENRNPQPRKPTLLEREERRATVAAAQSGIDAHADKLEDGLREQIDAIRNGQEISLQFIEEARRMREQLAQQQRQAVTFDKS